jgi:hypothetical protein
MRPNQCDHRQYGLTFLEQDEKAGVYANITLNFNQLIDIYSHIMI